MVFRLEMVGGVEPGRMLPILVDRPRVFHIGGQDLDAGVVEVSLNEGMCMVKNSSLRPVLVNGEERQVATLADGDLLRIGMDEFRVLRDAEEPVTCGFCQACCLPQESWSDGQEHLCAICLASGTIPVVPRSSEGIEVGASLAPAQLPVRSISDRRRRVISATMPAQIASKPGLLTRLSGVFSQRHRRHREVALRQERRHLLEEIGRLALSGSLFGLEEHQVVALQSGRGLNVPPNSQPRKSLERWRELRERVNLIDAEITAVRRQLGLGPDPETSLGRCELRAGVKGREERVYATLDAMETNDYLLAVEEPPLIRA